MARKITRRLFIGTAAAGSAAAAGFGGRWWFGYSRIAYAKAVVLKHLPYLTFAPGALDAFASDIAEYRLFSTNQRATMLFGVHLSRGLTWLMGAKQSVRLDYFETQLVSLFLMSSDFFARGEDIAKPVNYLTLADPYVNACSNTIAVLAE